MTITKGDLLAIIDLMGELAESSDTLEVDEAIATMETLRLVQSAVRQAEAMVETAVKRHLEAGSRELGGRVYARKPDGKWRTYHAEVAAAVVGNSVIDRRTGEMRDAKEAAQTAVDLMQALYVSPSNVPKKGGLDQVGLDKAEVSKWEKTGFKIEIIDMNGPGDEA